MVSTRFAHYELEERIGVGGMGSVFRARDTKLGRSVAIKVLSRPQLDDPERRGRLLREARAAAALNHPNVATVYEVGEARPEDPTLFRMLEARAGGGRGAAPSDGTPAGAPPSDFGHDDPDDGELVTRPVPYIAMEMVDGEDLRSLLARRRPSLDEAIDLALQIARGLAAAHAAGIVHRDLKPGNVLITSDGRAKLLDFGLAKIRDPERFTRDTLLTEEGMIMGTPPYIAPEILQGEAATPRSDLFSFGVLLYEMVAGEPPFPTGLIEYVRALAADGASTTPPSLVLRLSPDLHAVIDGLLARDPADRPADAGAVVEELGRLTGGDGGPRSLEPGRRPEGGGPERSSRPSRSSSFLGLSRRGWIAAGVVVLVLAALALAVTWPWGGPEEEIRVEIEPFVNATGDPAREVYAAGLGAVVASQLDHLRQVDTVPSDRLAGRVVEGRLERDGPHMRLELVVRERGAVLLEGPGGAPTAGDGREDGREEAGAGDRIETDAATVSGASPAGMVLWRGEVSGPIEEAPRLVRRAVLAVAAALGARTSFLDRWRLEAVTGSSEALDLYLEALPLLERREGVELRRAEELLRQALEHDSDFVLAQAALSGALYQLHVLSGGEDLELLDEAARRARLAVELEPDSPEAHLMLVQAYRGSEEQRLEAIASLREFVWNHPESAEGYSHLGLAYKNAEQLDEAAASFRQAIALDPGYWRHHDNLARVEFARGRLEEAAAAYAEADRRAPPRENRPLRNLFAVQLARGEYADAVATAERYDGLVTDIFASNLGAAYLFTGRLDEAEASYRRAVDLSRDDYGRAQALNGLGDALAAQGRGAEARAAWQSALGLVDGAETRPGEGDELLLFETLLLAKVGDCFTASRRASGSLRERIPESVTQLEYLAKIHALCAEPERALDALERALELGLAPEFARVQPELASLADEPRFRRLVGTSGEARPAESSSPES